MTSWLQDIEVAVFDMDGTLYQDHEFASRYIAHLLEGTPHEADIPAWQNAAAGIFAGDRPFRVGHWYDAANGSCADLAGALFPSAAMRAYDWDGGEALPPELAAAWPGDAAAWSEAAASRRLLYAGDAWSVVAVIAARLGVPEANRQRAFRQVREEMLAPPHAIARHDRLLAAVKRLPCRAMLLTNSPADTASAFVRHLGLEGAFEYTAFGSGKPDGLAALLTRLVVEECVPPARIVSIGDHAWNDLEPARLAGCRTVAVAPYAAEAEPTHHPWDLQIRSLDELAELIEQIQPSKEESLYDIRRQQA
ncbi:HAD family hydrolase [Paenibacillus sp. TRM 82003]|nr:HAD family hydrolase [Paenibacillus sp. TRM 82003]